MEAFENEVKKEMETEVTRNNILEEDSVDSKID